MSKISRNLDENILLKKIINRLSRNLKNFNKALELNENYINEIASCITKDTIFRVDGSEIVKPHTKAFESLYKVQDGNTGKIEDGYHMFEIAGFISKYEMSFSVYSKIYSSKEKNFRSENDETFKGLNFLSNHFENLGIKALDRGYDNKFYTYFTDREESFVIRAKKNRNVVHKGKVINILKLANKYRGKYSMIIKNKKISLKNINSAMSPYLFQAYLIKSLLL